MSCFVTKSYVAMLNRIKIKGSKERRSIKALMVGGMSVYMEPGYALTELSSASNAIFYTTFS